MLASVYDPTTKNASAFDMANMDESANEKILTSAERTQIATNKTNADASKVKTDLISITQAVNLDTIESDTSTNNAKVGITPTQANDIATNNVKISYTDAAAVALNTAKVVTPTITANTGTVISLTNVIGNLCNMASANPTTTYTTTGTTAGANAIVLINATSEPTITGATKIKGNAFIINTDMHLVVQYLGVTVQYFFIEL